MEIANFIKTSLPTKYDDVVYEIGKKVLYDTSDEALDHINKSLNFYNIVIITNYVFCLLSNCIYSRILKKKTTDQQIHSYTSAWRTVSISYLVF